MRIHKFVLMFITFFMMGIATVNAQKVESRSQFIKIEKTSHPHPMEWFVKAGGGITAVTGGDNIGNYNAALGFKRYFGYVPKGGYWGAMLGSTLFGYSDENYYEDNHWYETNSTVSFYLGPQIGYSKPLTDSLTFDIHLLATYQLAVKDNYGELGHHILGQLGLGLWINRFLVELDYQPSFIDNDGSNNDLKSHSVIFNIGYRF